MEFTAQETALIGEIKGQLNSQIEQLKGGLIDKSTFVAKTEALEAQIKNETSAIKTEFEAVLKEQGIALEELKANKGEQKTKTFAEQIMDGLVLNKEYLTAGRAPQPITFSVSKAAATMAMTNYSGGYVGISDWDSQLGQFARRRPLLQDVVRRVRVNSNYISWADKANADGGAGMQTEAGSKTQSDFDIVERKLPVETVASYITVSKQMLADLPYMNDAIAMELSELVELHLEDQILTGSGTTPNLKGIENYATAYAAGASFSNAIDYANIYDLIETARAQAGVANHTVDTVIMNTVDVTKMRLTKANDGQYVTMTPGGLYTSSGLRIIETNAVTANEMYVINSQKSVLGIREEMSITIGLNSDNFTKNLVTILGEMRAVHYIKENDKTAFIYVSDIAASIASLETP
jgi:HK97 family phage major capsid protein